jgi:hypothetical protein
MDGIEDGALARSVTVWWVSRSADAVPELLQPARSAAAQAAKIKLRMSLPFVLGVSCRRPWAPSRSRTGAAAGIFPAGHRQLAHDDGEPLRMGLTRRALLGSPLLLGAAGLRLSANATVGPHKSRLLAVGGCPACDEDFAAGVIAGAAIVGSHPQFLFLRLDDPRSFARLKAAFGDHAAGRVIALAEQGAAMLIEQTLRDRAGAIIHTAHHSIAAGLRPRQLGHLLAAGLVSDDSPPVIEPGGFRLVSLAVLL